MNKKGFAKTLIIVGFVIFIGIVGYFIFSQQSSSPTPSRMPSPTPSPTPPDSPTQPSTQEIIMSNECGDLINYGVEAYYDGWKKTFKTENNLSELQFNDYITVTTVSLRPVGNTCELSIRYKVKKDWFVANRIDDMALGVPPTITPDNLPLESDPTKSGRIGVSTINLHDSFSFKSESEALSYFVSAYNLKGTGATVQNRGFQYFWNKEAAEKSGYPFAGEGGEAYITVVGTIDSGQNKCYSGELSLVTKETTFRETPCRIY